MGWRAFLKATESRDRMGPDHIVDLLLFSSGWKGGGEQRKSHVHPTRIRYGMLSPGSIVPATELRDWLIRAKSSSHSLEEMAAVFSYLNG